jgi:hypothetical protein
MPRHCSVCTHAQRDEIDRKLLVGQVNLSELGRTYQVSRDALRSHRTRHLEELLAAYRASPEALTLPQLRGEASRLYQITLDALDNAQRGVVVGVDSDGQPVRRVSLKDGARRSGSKKSMSLAIQSDHLHAVGIARSA